MHRAIRTSSACTHRRAAMRDLALLLAACVLPPGQAAAAGYPERPVTIVSAFPAGASWT